MTHLKWPSRALQRYFRPIAVRAEHYELYNACNTHVKNLFENHVFGRIQFVPSLINLFRFDL